MAMGGNYCTSKTNLKCINSTVNSLLAIQSPGGLGHVFPRVSVPQLDFKSIQDPQTSGISMDTEHV